MTSSQYEITIDSDIESAPAEPEKLKALVEGILSKFGIQRATVDIAVLGDEAISQIHQQYLGRAAITDVISFDLSEEPKARCFQIAVNAEQAAREGLRRNLSTEAELALYVTHGMLHNLGFDDSEPEESEKMHKMEDEILIESGYGAVYR